MRVKVLFFAQLRDWFGRDERFVDLPEGSTLEGLAELLFSGLSPSLRGPEGAEAIPLDSLQPLSLNTTRLLRPLLRDFVATEDPRNGVISPPMSPTEFKVPIRYAVNENFVNLDQKLKDGDTVAFLAPVSGG